MRIESERQEWSEKRAAEADEWIAARSAEIAADRERCLGEIRARADADVEGAERLARQHLDKVADKLRKEQGDHERLLESKSILYHRPKTRLTGK